MRVAVIGANLGDEGKGLIVDALVRRYGPDRTIVVRHNGGAQAGHTVVDGTKRHVFGHVGAGTLAGAATHLSRFFISNPLLLRKEVKALGAFSSRSPKPVVSVDPRSLVTVPSDIMINCAFTRGQYNTCGVGINETIVRSEADQGVKITVADIFSGEYKDKLNKLSTWIPYRCLELTTSIAEFEYAPVMDQFHEACDFFKSFVVPITDEQMVKSAIHLLFEGAQGLLLDETRGWFPHVTRSSTGTRNILEIVDHLDHVYYVTRTYMTRHGMGPLPDECGRPSYVVDDTNIPNPYQGGLRFGRLNVQTLRDRIAIDAHGNNYPYSIAMTCLDQTTPMGKIMWRGDRNVLRTGIPRELVAEVGNVDIVSTGPTAKDVEFI